MTKDWEAVRSTIKQLSVDRKKSLEEVKAVMESKHGFRASTRAYRLKLKEWGYMRHKQRRTPKPAADGLRSKPSSELAAAANDERDRSTATLEPAFDQRHDPTNEVNQRAESTRRAGDESILELAQALASKPVEPVSRCRSMIFDILAEILEAVLEGDAVKLEQEIVKTPRIVNFPIGLPFEPHGGRFFNHPAVRNCILLQHREQNLLDVACALPEGPVMEVLMAYGARGSIHPAVGMDLALHNAIRNGRNLNVQRLLDSGHSTAAGRLGHSGRPLLQAVLWDMPEIVRCLVDRGAPVDEIDAETPSKSVLQRALDHRVETYKSPVLRERSEKIIRILLDAGAVLHPPSAENGEGATPLQVFLKPWLTDTSWLSGLTSSATECLMAFIRNGADLETKFPSFPCPDSRGDTLIHQLLWHTTPEITRNLIENAISAQAASGHGLLQEIVVHCPCAERRPADTLRDIEVLLKGGYDPNHVNIRGETPLTACLANCSSTDLVPLLRSLLSAGCDPEWRDGKGRHPVILAARLFEKSMQSRLLELLLSKCRGRRSNNDCSPSLQSYLPIPERPTYHQVVSYSKHGVFQTKVQGLLPEDVSQSVQKAAFNVASRRWVDAVVVAAAENNAAPLTMDERRNLKYFLELRQAEDLPEYSFNQQFVLKQILPTEPTHSIQNRDVDAIDTMASH